VAVAFPRIFLSGTSSLSQKEKRIKAIATKITPRNFGGLGKLGRLFLLLNLPQKQY